MPSKRKAPPSTDPPRAHVQAGTGGKGGKGGRGKGRGYGVAPVETLSDSDRERAIRTIRNLQAILDAQAERVARAMAESLLPPPDPKPDGWRPYRLDVYEAQAANAYSKTIAEVLAAHPGLLELANASGDEGSETETALLEQAMNAAGAADVPDPEPA